MAPPPLATDLDDLLWRALADPTRRHLLDLLRAGPATVGALAAEFGDLTRFAVMKHLAVLEGAGLVLADKIGRERWCRVNPAPLRAICLRWLRPFDVAVADQALRLKEIAERRTIVTREARVQERPR